MQKFDQAMTNAYNSGSTSAIENSAASSKGGHGSSRGTPAKLKDKTVPKELTEEQVGLSKCKAQLKADISSATNSCSG